MKKISVLSLIIMGVILISIFTSNNANAQSIDNWFIAGSERESYNVGLDKQTFKSGGVSAYIESDESKTKIQGFGTLMQTASAENYVGKRIKMTAYIKTKGVVEKAGMWLRVDSKEPVESLSFDNMADRPIKGNTDWKKYEIVLDVPENSGTLSFGLLVRGIGKAWVDDISFEVVGNAVSTTSKKKKPIPSQPMNLDFSE